jgi:hypothetical protein
VDHTKLDKNSVQAVHKAYFPTTKYRNISALYRNKARAFDVSLSIASVKTNVWCAHIIFIAHIVISSSAGAAVARGESTSRGVPLEDISDDEDDPFEEEEEVEKEVEESDLEEDEEAIMPPHNTVPLYSMDFKLPFIISTYQREVDDFAKVEVVVPMPKEFFSVDIEQGMAVKITIRMPSFVTDEERVIRVNRGVSGFNHNTSEAQAM